MTLKEMMAARPAAQPTPAPIPPAEALATPPRTDYLARQDGTEPLPESWPIDESDFATGNDLICVQNPHLESYLALQLPSGKIKYLMGPMKTLNIPF